MFSRSSGGLSRRVGHDKLDRPAWEEYQKAQEDVKADFCPFYYFITYHISHRWRASAQAAQGILAQHAEVCKWRTHVRKSREKKKVPGGKQTYRRTDEETSITAAVSLVKTPEPADGLG